VLLLPAGCRSTQYVLRQAIGEIGVLVRSVPISQALETGGLTTEQARKLRLIVEARDFARDELGLSVGWSFTRFHDTTGRPLAFNLSATPKDSLQPYRWWFPVIGHIDYIGFFDRAEGEQVEADLKGQGYDTWLRRVDAFSSLGWLPDPVHSPMLERNDFSLVDTVIHELAHNTVYASGRSDFNESLATFIGRSGALLYYERRKQDADAVERLRQRYADTDRINVWLAEFLSSLEEYYARDLTRAAKIAGREAVFQAARDRFTAQVSRALNDPERSRGWGRLSTNNAQIRQYRRYNRNLDLFAAVYDKVGRDFGAFLRTLRAAADSPDPWQRLRRAADTP
jgi:predicted aminopeptidase